MLYFLEWNFQGPGLHHHTITSQSFKNRQTLEQFFEPLYFAFLAFFLCLSVNFDCPRAHISHLLSLGDIFWLFWPFYCVCFTFLAFVSLFLAFLFIFMSFFELWSSQSSPKCFWSFLVCFVAFLRCLVHFFWPCFFCFLAFCVIFISAFLAFYLNVHLWTLVLPELT